MLAPGAHEKKARNPKPIPSKCTEGRRKEVAVDRLVRLLSISVCRGCPACRTSIRACSTSSEGTLVPS